MATEKSNARQASLDRASELKKRAESYLKNRANIPSGLELASHLEKKREKYLDFFQGTQDQWEDWHWQLRNRITDTETLNSLIPLTPEQREDIEKVGKEYRWAVSPYYLSLIDENDPQDPILLQSIPSVDEILDTVGEADPMGEEFTNPAPCITRRYPDRLIINVTNLCAMYCRHCQRRRNIGEVDQHQTKANIEAALDYIRANPEIRDVLITGGDALLLSDQMIDWILGELHKIEHVEIKRIGTRTPVTLPMRITDELCAIFEKYPPLYINTQFNHPMEVTEEAKKAADRLIKAGVMLGNQAVLLKGINDDPDVMKRLNHELLKIRIRPYYIFHAKNVQGTSHFIPSIEDGLKIMENLRGYTSGMAIPTYIINAPGGKGKTPILPEYLVSLNEDEAVLRTWEGNIIHYPNKK
ncbi:MAG: glutamate 2,3-aminomutase [Desulfitobacterium sp.]|nr:glutamate 2,3-aminomutase [Desulfitobacterium sp.]